MCVIVGRVKGCGFDASKTACTNTSQCLLVTTINTKRGRERDRGVFVWFVRVLSRVGLVRQSVCVVVGRENGCGFDASKTACKNTSQRLLVTTNSTKMEQERQGGVCMVCESVVACRFGQTRCVCHCEKRKWLKV